MRHIAGITGCPKTRGIEELETTEITSVRIVDAQDSAVVLRAGTQEIAARLTPEEARHVAMMLNEAADRADTR